MLHLSSVSTPFPRFLVTCRSSGVMAGLAAVLLFNHEQDLEGFWVPWDGAAGLGAGFFAWGLGRWLVGVL